MENNTLKIKKQSLITILFFFLCFVLTRQFPLSLYIPSALSITLFGFIFIFLILYSNQIKFDHRLILLLIYISLSLTFSLLNSNDINSLPRFLIILFLINFVLLLPFYKVNLTTAFNLALSIQAIFLITFEIYLILFFSGKDYTIIRQFFLSHNLGDVYTYSGYFYRIQIIGNALIPFAFMVSYFKFRVENGKFLFVILYFFACIIASNLMFLIAIFLYIPLIEIIKSKARIKLSIRNFFIFLLILISFPFIIDVVYSNVLLKLIGGESSSLGTRFDQANALMIGLAESYYDILFGQGLGSKLNIITAVRDYRKFIYYELQSLYILYQIGFLGFLSLIVLHAYLFLYICKNKFIILIYCMYVFYAITNPYIFDTTQVIVLIYLVSLSKYFKSI
ncbi:hypothetical protein KUA04_03270 [Proteus mirabilis]|uniref:hypothetical protein n=1 Tax=Proteus mirabilis TaxID=584 RepID=UPI002181FCEE|nr:hypothetical protein [Proteus mirabilis]MCT0087487.1 hypothetical protein [Proteus mirabilis]